MHEDDTGAGEPGSQLDRQVAILAASGRFPGATSTEELWSRLAAGREGIVTFSETELRAAGVSDAELVDPRYVRAGAPLADVDLFDAGFFGFHPREAQITDPQQRLLLECAWEVMELAGYGRLPPRLQVGVFAGSSLSPLFLELQQSPELLADLGPFRITLGNDKDFLATWVAYKLNLRGPALTVQTACSTSLVAVHLACQSLLTGESDLALAGGVAVRGQQVAGYLYQEGGILSPDGRCRAFDARAQGTVAGSGVGVVLLKRLADALADGDPILAVIRGSAVNNDGDAKAGFTAPSVEGQARVIAEALAVAGVPAETLRLIEAHGTGTSLGDPIEVEALNRALTGGGSAPLPAGSCALGSVKTNLGHLDAAAGVTGLIKAVLALQHRELPPSLGFDEPNPAIPFAATPFYVNTELREWPAGPAPRRAGVSSFGIGGTNAHVIVEEAPTPPPTVPPARRAQLLLLSAKSATALERAREHLADHLEAHPALELADVAFTLQRGRKRFEHRAAWVASSVPEAVAALRQGSGRAAGVARAGAQPLAFLFPGQGAQFAGMGRQLYGQEPVFRRTLDACAAALRDAEGLELLPLLFQLDGEALAHTELAQPALFAVELGLARLWQSWGAKPTALLGHSLGQYVAATVAGVFTLEDGMRLVALRGRLVSRLPLGAMAAVALGAEALANELDGNLHLAAENAPERCVVSGTPAAVEALAARLGARGVAVRRLATSHAFHTPALAPIVPELRRALAELTLAPPRIPLLSNASGDWASAEEIVQPEFWLEHLLRPARLASCFLRLLDDPSRAYLEAGPGRSLLQLLQPLARRARVEPTIVPGLEPDGARDEGSQLLQALGRAWTQGLELDGPGFWAPQGGDQAHRRRVALPTYPFERQSYRPPRRNPAPEPSAPPIVAPSAVAPPAAANPPAHPSRRERLRAELLELVAELVGAEAGQLATDQRFVEAGVDSLLLIQASRAIERRYGRRVPLARLLTDAGTLDDLAAVLDRELPPEKRAPTPLPPRLVEPEVSLPEPPEPATTKTVPGGREAYVPYEPIRREAEALAPHERAHLARLVARYNQRTAGSKRAAERYRTPFADSRNTAGFRLAWKDLVYPIVVDRASGARIWDVDGNEYVDITMGFGVNLFGHSPPFVTEAVARQLERGLALGPQSDLAGEVAERLCRLTGLERAAFTNSGTEAVMVAMRLARAATGRDKIALFAGSYHGIFDGTLARPGRRDGRPAAVPVAPGIPPSLVEDLVILPYGEPESLEQLRRLGPELAAVMVEPVQSRRPDLQPREFLHELRALTAEAGCALIFDEMITGLRCHPGGAQAHFGVRADLATYGKVLGGGLPIGAVAGSAAFVDGIDGGRWAYGDGSFPGATKTLYAGTFCKHPLAMASARAVLAHLEQAGPALQAGLNARTADLCARLEASAADAGVPFETTHFGSLFRLGFRERSVAAELFFFHLLERGVYLWEGRTSFLSTAHTADDERFVEAAVAASFEELLEAGLFPRGERAQKVLEPSPSEPASLPMSEGQRRIWFLTRLGPEASRAYHESLALELEGEVDAATLLAAVERLAQRHAVLRATVDADALTLRVSPRLRPHLGLLDLRGVLEPDLARRCAEREAARDFDLEHGPLFGALLLRTGARHATLVLTFHHLVVDGASVARLLRELAELYAAALEGRAPRLGPTSVHPEAAHTESVRPEETDPPPPLELPLDRARPAAPSFRGGLVRARLGAPTLLALRRLAAAQGATLLGPLFAGWAALLHRLSGQSRFLIGLASAGVTEEGAAVGYRLEQAPMLVTAEPRLSLAELLTRVQAEIVRSSGPDRRRWPLATGDARRPSRITAALNLDREGGALAFGPLTLRVERVFAGAAKLEAYLALVEQREGLALEWEHRSDLHLEATVERWLRAYQHLLEELARDPQQPLAAVSLLAPAERQQVLVRWPGPARQADEPFERSLAQTLAQWAEAAPDAVALRRRDAQLSWAELGSRVRAFAARLLPSLQGPEPLVAVALERDLDWVVAVLGVWQAGAVYQPLDPAYPVERLRYLLADGGARCLVAADGRPDWCPPEVALVAPPQTGDTAGPTEAPGPPEADALAYVIHTSGSTGRPKGVGLTHRGLALLAETQARAFGLGPGTRQLQFASASFDASISELATVVWAGATLVLGERAELRPGPELAALLERAAIEVATLPPSVLAVLPSTGYPALETLITAGEACPAPLAQRWSVGRRLVNAYGPTEVTVCATLGEIDGAAPPDIGHPLPQQSAFVLGPTGEAVGVGVWGELALGGAGLARGYHGRPALTAERFRPHPYAQTPGARLYASGDRARWRPDGRLELAGRFDDQVKVRGVRIELGEVEAALAALPGVAAAAAGVDRSTDPARLLAFVVAAADAPGADAAVLSAATLRAELARRLPEALLPAEIRLVERLPTTPAGKVDRSALLALSASTEPALPGAIAPSDAVERFLLELWLQALGRPAASDAASAGLGVEDNFFAAGGDSLRSALLVNQLQRELGEVVHVVLVFDAPTIAEQARFLVREYPQALARRLGVELQPTSVPEVSALPLSDEDVRVLRSGVAPLALAPGAPAKPNPPAVFLLSAPRSGSTLLRVMLAGHPALFAPPELELLSFQTLAARRAAFEGRFAFWLEGVTRTLMELESCSLETAEELMAGFERAGWTTQRFYRHLQQLAAPRLLIDKTPAYALDRRILEKAEQDFEQARYIHLVRHPQGMIRSFEEARLDEVFFRHPHTLSRRRLAEAVWTLSNENIVGFLAGVPAERQFFLRFEDLVADPEGIGRELCRFLGVPFDAALLQPYERPEGRMTTGVHQLSRMMGDLKFHTHRGIDARVAERWRNATLVPLGAPTVALADRWGYADEAAVPAPALARRPEALGRQAPLSFAQERLWLQHRLDPGSSAYNIPAALELEGELDVRALAAAFTAVVARHEPLRTRYELHDDQPVQVIDPPLRAALAVVDLSALAPEDEETLRTRLIAQESARPFELRRGPVLRVTLLRVTRLRTGSAPARHVLVTVLHHIATDGASMPLLVRDLGMAYAAGTASRTPTLPPLPFDYADYAVWQRSLSAEPVFQNRLERLRTALAEIPQALDLPFDHPRQPRLPRRGAHASLPVSAGVETRLRTLAAELGTTPFACLLASFEALLVRLTGQRCFAVASPATGRSRPELEELVGLFVTTLLVPAQVDPKRSFRELVEATRTRVVEALGVQDLPPESWLPKSEPGGVDPFQVYFLYQTETVKPTSVLPGLTVRALGGADLEPKAELALVVEESAGRWRAVLQFDAERLEAPSAERWLGVWLTLLEAAAAEPDRKLDALPLLTASARSEVLGLGRSPAQGSPPAYFHSTLETLARTLPDRILATDGGEQLSAAELNRRANRLAHRLRARGLGHEVVVGLAVERGVDWLAAVFGLSKAGAVYLPLDPAYPAERLAWMIEDARPRYVLVERGATLAVPEPALRLELEALLAPGTADDDPGLAIDLDQLAYLLYTSGSTGRPKGVSMPERGLPLLLANLSAHLAVDPERRILQFAPASFDASLWEIVVALSSGSRLVLGSRVQLQPGPELVSLLERERIRMVSLPPSVLAVLPSDGLPDLETVVTAGEACPPALAARWASGRTLLNGYGPTEATIAISLGKLDGRGVSDVGRPLAHQRVAIVDPRGEPVPIGVWGELTVAGDALARGYRGRPGLTAERFRPEADGPLPGTRSYWTGDRCRWRADGRLEIAGRLDLQIKIRGVRIEIGEVEATLSEHPQIAAAAVLALPSDGTNRLVAFLQPEPDATLELAEVRSFLAQRLPVAMIPGELRLLERLPQTASGKIDRRALNRLEATLLVEAVAAQEPRTDTERTLARLWQGVLDKPILSIHQDFFAAGGDSLRAALLVNRLQGELGLELPAAFVFEHLSIATQAAALAALPATALTTIPARPPELRARAPLSFAQERMWFLHQLEPESPAYNVPIALRVRGRLAPAQLDAALAGLVARHESLRTRFELGTRFDLEAQRPVQVIAPAEPAHHPLAVVDLAALDAARREADLPALAARFLRRPFELARGPLLRAALLRLGVEDQALLLGVHHIVSDGASMRVLASELFSFYGARPGSSPLPALPVQVADHAVWQRQRLAGATLEADLAFWRQELAELPPLLELPTDRPRPALATTRGQRLARRFGPALLSATEAFAREERATLFGVLLATFEAVLYRWSGGERAFAVGSPIHGRNRPELEGLIGLFANTLALAARLDGRASFRHHLAQVQERAFAAYRHAELPFEQVVEALRREPSLSHTPIFQVVLVLQDPPRGLAAPAGLEIRPLELEAVSAKFDLTLSYAASEAGLYAAVTYNADLFDEVSIERLLLHLEVALEAATRAPETTLDALAWLSAAERQELVAASGDDQPVPTAHASLGEALAAVAERSPEAIALVDGEERLSYGELLRRARRLAARLRAEGVTPGSRVPVLGERSRAGVTALVAVIEAGAAYVPIDPAYPHERRRTIVDDALTGQAARVVLGLPELRAERPDLVTLPLPSAADPGPGPALPDAARLGPGALAYVIFTSGSTGRPKGVMVRHREVLRLFAATDGWFGFGADDVWTLFHSLAFDFSVWEMWGALLHGGRLVVVPHELSRSPAQFAELLAQENVTVLNQTPSAFRQLSSAQEAGTAPSTGLALRSVIFGGEALELGALAPWFARHGAEHPRLVNMYGITETTVHVSYRPLGLEDLTPGLGSRIGGPIPDLRLVVVDPRGDLVPLGVPGEMWVGGDGVALGYLHQPRTTAERFTPDPWSSRLGARLYRSGDLARRRPGGDLEYLRRRDHQVKVRGFRIELGEIEAALTALPEVREAVVVVHRDETAEPRLVAYFVAAAGSAPRASSLRSALAERLPEPLVPAFFVPLTALPLTGNGKVDRRALPGPTLEREASAPPLRAPGNPLEAKLLALWQEVLGLEALSVDDDFFAVGGDSIRGAVLINRLQQELGAIVHVVAIFDAPTIVGLAGYLTERYPAAIASWLGTAAANTLPTTSPAATTTAALPERVDEQALRWFARLLPPAPPARRRGRKNPPAVFVLAPPRSGTTLLRVLLAGHPELFAPPELELLGFESMAERRRVFSGRLAFWLEGTQRAFMAAEDLDLAAARTVLERAEAEDWSPQRVYRRLQEAIGGRRLVDKTPSYALDLVTLQKAEAWFDDARYLHLVRHPRAAIRSFEEAHLEELFFRESLPFAPRALAELVWTQSHRHLLAFQQEIPPERWLTVHFEQLVRAPEAEMARVLDFLGLEFHPDVLQPYAERAQRMTDGVHETSLMLGDVKFHRHQGIDPHAAERSKPAPGIALGEPTEALAAQLGYRPDGSLGLLPRPAIQRETAPLSFAQERLWFLDQLEAGSGAYAVPLAGRWRGPLDLGALAPALDGVVAQHEILRTVYGSADGEPFQRILPYTRLPQARVPFALVDLTALGPATSEAASRRVAELASAEARRPFRLDRELPLRTTVLRLGADDHALLLTLHHIACDGASLPILLGALRTGYLALRAGHAPALAPPVVQYADYALDQRRRLDPAAVEREIAFWRAALEGTPPLLELPTDRPRPGVASTRGGRVGRRLPAALVARLSRLLARERLTPFLLWLGAWQLLLGRHAGARDVVVGTPVRGRHQPELEGLIGLFVNSLALRATIDPHEPAEAFLRRVRAHGLAAYEHQELPFEKIVDALRPERSRSYTPIFQVLLVVEGRSAPSPGSADPFRLELLPTPEDLPQLGDLTVTMGDDGDSAGVPVSVGYNRDLFDASTLLRLLARFERLLEGLAEDPATPVAALPWLTAAEVHQATREWNDTRTAWPETLLPQTLLPGRLLAQAQAAPDRLAVLEGDHHVSYGHLWEQALALAEDLTRRGVGPEARVGLCLERGLGAIVALLGVWQSGAAYVPIEPSAPPARRELVQTNAGCKLVLTAETPAPARAESHALARASSLALARPPQIEPGNLAYVLYTSGSTGEPKGVEVTHANVANIVSSYSTSYGLAESDRVLQQTTLAFDVSVNEIFPVLAVGGALVVVSPTEALDFPALLRRLAATRVSILGTAPSVLARLNEAVGPDFDRSELGCLRLVLSGGEALATTDIDRLRPHVRITNGYGPTEATVCALSFDLAEHPPGAPIPIGRPLANYQAFVCDAFGQPLAAGVAGELVLGGDGLARGYLGHPARTAERFVPHPWAQPPAAQHPWAWGERLYRTGDRAQLRADGRVDFLGRLDRQVKLRGLRIELGEIEAQLAAHPSVRDCAVICREDRPGDKKLVAYVAPSAADAAELAAHLGRHLPAYMVPADFVALEALPLSATGKVDLARLPLPTAKASERPLLAPRTELEARLLEIWSETLERDDLSVEDSFFALGGHSLLAVKLVARIAARLGTELPLAALFEAPTIARLAELIESGPAARLWSPLVPLQERGDNPPLFFVHPIGGEVLVYERLAHALGPNQPFYGIQAPHLGQAASAGESIEAMAERYVLALRRRQPAGPYRLGGWSFGCIVAFEMAHQLRRAHQEVALLALLDGRPRPVARPEGATLPQARLLQQLLRETAHQAGRELPWAPEAMPAESEDDALAWLVEQGRATQLLPPEIDLDRVRLYLRGFATRAQAAERYRPEPLDVDILFVRAGITDPRLAADEPTAGWGELARSVRVESLATRHELLLLEPAVVEVARCLEAALGNERGPETPSAAEIPTPGTVWAEPASPSRERSHHASALDPLPDHPAQAPPRAAR